MKMGCGFDARYRGTAKGLKSADPDIDFRGTCPAYWKNSPFVNDFVRLYKWRSNLPDPRTLPNRFLMACEYYDYAQARKQAEEAKESKS